MSSSYYSDEYVSVFNCRWQDVIDSLCFDVVVSDPPYGMNYQSGANSSKSISSTGKRYTRKVTGDDEQFDPSPWLHVPCCFTGAHWFYDKLPPGGGWHTWNKRGDYKPLDQADADQIWCSVHSPSRVFNLVWRGICRHSENTELIVHPTQKPVALMNWMIELVGVKDGQCVIDPFMGSGSTLVAAKRMGLKAIGCEIETEYCERAVERLRQGVLPFAG